MATKKSKRIKPVVISEQVADTVERSLTDACNGDLSPTNLYNELRDVGLQRREVLLVVGRVTEVYQATSGFADWPTRGAAEDVVESFKRLDSLLDRCFTVVRFKSRKRYAWSVGE